MYKRPKLMICGYGRHGKDTVAEMIKIHGFEFMSSSWFCCTRFIFDELRYKYPYKDAQHCFDDRANHRAEWHDLINQFCTPDLARLSREIFKENDVYVGIRHPDEFNAAKQEGLFDLSIWVDRSKHLPPEDSSSNKMTPELCDITIDNNGTLKELTHKINRLMRVI